MNGTNRAVNRVALLLVGAVLLAAGGVVLLTSLWPAAATLWNKWVPAAVSWMQETDDASRIPAAGTASWFAIGVLAVLLIVITMSVVVIARLGGGRSSVVIRDESGQGAQGAVVVRQGFASDAITRSLSERDEILSSSVSAGRVGGTDVLHVSITPRQNTSPVDVARRASRLLSNLATLTGRDIPALISIRSSVRARLAADQSRVR